jgi:ribosomal protein S8
MSLFYRNLILLKNNSLAKKQYVDLVINKLTLKILNLFYEKGFIFGYMYLNRFKLRVFLKYYFDVGFFDKLKLFDTRSKFISYKSLVKFFKFNSGLPYFICLSSSKGIYFLFDFLHLNYRCGGFLLFSL